MSKVIGLTGGIATGKSTVTAYLRQSGFYVIDADQLVHQLQKSGQRLYEAILKSFGSSFFDAEGNLLRQKLGDTVFSNPTARKNLSEIQDRIIREEIEFEREKILSQTDQPFFIDIPLLFEASYEYLFDEIWLVSLPRDLQVKRLMKRSNLTEKEAEARINTQMPLEEKEKCADFILDNSKNLENLHSQIDAGLRRL